MGDGGAAIGLQHIFECARLNVDLTLVVCNNQNYGMTGGQHSAYTLPGVKTSTTPAGASQHPFALCEMLAPLGVPRARVLATGRELRSVLAAALEHRGFSLVETLNYCPSYAGKLNPEQLSPKGMEAFFRGSGLEFGSWPGTLERPALHFTADPSPPAPKSLAREGSSPLRGQRNILLAGSAGEGVQNAAELLARAAIRSGLHVVLRGEYPVTVGKGFSSSFLLVSEHEILSPAAERWDVALVCSGDGLAYARARMSSIDWLVLDSSLELPPEAARSGSGGLAPAHRELWHLHPGSAPQEASQPEAAPSSAPEPPAQKRDLADFRRHGPKAAAFAALAWLLRQDPFVSLDALRQAVEELGSAKARESLLGVLG
jgi:hypothetical protein